MENEYYQKEFIFEKFTDYETMDIWCSTELNLDTPPSGSKVYFLRHGFLVVKNLYERSDLINKSALTIETTQNFFKQFIQNVFNIEVMNESIEFKRFSVERDFLDVKSNSFDFTILCPTSNDIDGYPNVFIKSKKDNFRMSLDDNYAILFGKDVELFTETYSDGSNFISKFISKIKKKCDKNFYEFAMFNFNQKH